MGFYGYRRADGRAGVRNHVAVVSSVSCANGVVNAIGRALPKAKTITHPEGCGRGPTDWAIAYRTLLGLCTNPNVAGVLVVGLGCEFIPAGSLAKDIEAQKKPVEYIVIQDEGGSGPATAKGVKIAEKLLAHSETLRREECVFEELVLGLECGGSDALSGVTANPLVGSVSDWLVGFGGTVILSETTEAIGAEHILARRAATPEIARQITDLVKNQKKKAYDVLGDLAHMVISPGNVEGGLSNITEKSLGCIIKGGSTTLNEVLEYSQRPTKKGLVFMDTPGSDIFSITAEAAGGAQIIAFTTGRGSCVGFPIAPVIKIASNQRLFEMMPGDMDVNSARILTEITLEQARQEFTDLLIRVANGEKTRAEINQQDVLSIMTLTGPF